MPTKIYIGPDWQKRAGISIEWTPSKQRIDISGFYDGCVAIDGESMTLYEFFDRLKITEVDCRRAFRKEKEKND